MEDLHVPLSDRQQAFVDEQVASGSYASAAEMVAALIDADAKVKAQAKLDEFLLAGIQGEAREWTDADWERLHRRATGVD